MRVQAYMVFYSSVCCAFTVGGSVCKTLMPGIRVAQINLQHKRTATLELCRILQDGLASVALVQEPYFRKGVFYQANTVNPGFSAFNKSGMTNARMMPRACILVNNAIQASLILELTTRDVCVVKVTLTHQNIDKTYVYCSAYLPYEESSPTEDFKRAVTYCESNGLPLVVGSDANAHHIIWGSSDINQRGIHLMEYLSSTNLHILNIGNRPTFVRSDREEVLDITLCSTRMAHELTNWHVPDEGSLSDHRYIFFDHDNVSLKVTSFRNPRSTDWGLFNEVLATNLLRFQYPSIVVPNDLDDAVNTVTDVIMDAYEQACPLRTLKTTKGTPWWNRALDKLKQQLRTSWNRRAGDDSLAFRANRKAYKKALRSAERSSWRNMCTSVSSVHEASRLNKILSKTKDFRVNNIRNSNGEYASSDEDVLKCLFDTHFPGCREEILSDEQEFFSGDHFSWVMARRIVTYESIKWSIDSFSPYKSPGMDGIFPVFLQKGFEHIKTILKEIMVGSLATGYIPKTWREINVKFIPKAGRASYEEAKSYRPISLSSFLLKSLERIVDHYIRNESLKDFPLHPMQHAYQRGKSTTTLLHNVVHDIEKAFSLKHSSLGVFLDIEGAFDNVSFESIIEAARMYGVPPFITSWIHNMLSNRILCSSLRQAVIRVLSLCGCPQGGVISPLLWLLVGNGLLRKLNDLGIPTYGFADDYLILISGMCINTLFDLMQQALRAVENWCDQIGLSVNPSKTSLVLFTERRALNGVRPLRFFGSEVSVTDQVKYLGIILDSKLNWSAHIDFRLKAACMAFGQCRRAFGSTWGLKPKYIHWIYTTVVRPILAYGCLVWWQRGEVARVVTQLNHLQRMCLMALTGAFTTTPTAALEALLSIKPLHIHLKQEAQSCAYRLQAIGLWRPNPVDRNNSHTRIWKDLVQRDNFVLAPSDITLSRSFPYRDYETIFPLRELWLSGYWESHMSQHVSCYTDGSLEGGRAGAGVYCRELELEDSYSLGRHCTVFQAEVFAIICGVLAALRQKLCGGRSIYFCSDSQAAIKALASAESRSQLVNVCRSLLEDLSTVNNVFIVWVPGHSGITGNERADELARSGAAIEFVGPEPALPISPCLVRRRISSWAESAHKVIWDNLDTCRQTKLYLKEPSIKVSKYLLDHSKQNCSILVRALTGHCKLNYHMATVRLAESFSCDSCNAEYETPYHLICSCSAFAQLRFRIFGYHVIDEVHFGELNLKDVLSFITKCGKRF